MYYAFILYTPVLNVKKDYLLIFLLFLEPNLCKNIIIFANQFPVRFIPLHYFADIILQTDFRPEFQGGRLGHIHQPLMTWAQVGIYLRGGQSLMPQQGFCSNFSILRNEDEITWYFKRRSILPDCVTKA